MIALIGGGNASQGLRFDCVKCSGVAYDSAADHWFEHESRMAQLSRTPSPGETMSTECDSGADGDADDGYDLLIRCLRTGAVRELRMILVDGELQISPVVENRRPARTAPGSLSRREAGILQMIAWGMSNKRMARSLGITPETVKTHVKAILNKLKARTRAQAVARRSIGLL